MCGSGCCVLLRAACWVLKPQPGTRSSVADSVWPKYSPHTQVDRDGSEAAAELGEQCVGGTNERTGGRTTSDTVRI